MVLAGCNALLPIGTHIGFHSHTQTVNGASGFAVTHFASIDNAVPAQRFGRAGSGASVATRGRCGIVIALLAGVHLLVTAENAAGSACELAGIVDAGYAGAGDGAGGAKTGGCVAAVVFGLACGGTTVAARRIGIVALLTDFRRAIATDSRPGGRGGRGNAIDHTQLGAAVAAHEIAVVPLL